MSKIKIIVFGGRDYDQYKDFECQLVAFIARVGCDVKNIEIVSGGCSAGVPTFTRSSGRIVFGADGMAEKFATYHMFGLKIFDADWQKYGKAAGPIRNNEMAQYGSYALGFWDGISRGTADMAEKLENNKVYCELIRYDRETKKLSIKSLKPLV